MWIFKMKSSNLRDLGDESDCNSSCRSYGGCLLRSLRCMAWLAQTGLKSVYIL